MSEFKLNSNLMYSSYDLTLDYGGVGHVHNSYLFHCFELLNRIGKDQTISRLREIAIEETKLGESAGVYPEGTIEKIIELYSIFEESQDDMNKLIDKLQVFERNILSDSKFNESLVLSFANLSLHSAIFWNNFEKENPDMMAKAVSRGRGAFIAASDALGGITAAWHGSKAGAQVGAVFGNPVAGILVGGIGGLLLGGAVASGTAYYASR